MVPCLALSQGNTINTGIVRTAWQSAMLSAFILRGNPRRPVSRLSFPPRECRTQQEATTTAMNRIISTLLAFRCLFRLRQRARQAGCCGTCRSGGTAQAPDGAWLGLQSDPWPAGWHKIDPARLRDRNGPVVVQGFPDRCSRNRRFRLGRLSLRPMSLGYGFDGVRIKDDRF